MNADIGAVIDNVGIAMLIPMGISGGALVQSLLDNHPQVSTLPGNLALPGLDSETVSPLSPDQAAREFVDGNPNCFAMIKARSDLPKSHSPKVCDVDLDLDAYLKIFSGLLAQLPRFTQREILLAAHAAWSLYLGRDPAQIRVILIHVHYIHAHLGRCCAKLSAWPNTVSWLLTVRDPREYIASLKKRHAGLGNRTGGTIYGAIDQHLALMQMVHGGIIDQARCHIIELPVLHRQGEAAVLDIARRLGITPCPQLLESTFCGRPWLGNAADGKPVLGLDPGRSIPNYKEALEEWEIVMSDYLLKPVHDMMRFPPGSPTPTLGGYLANLTRLGRLWPENFPMEMVRLKLAAEHFDTGMSLPALPLPVLRLVAVCYHLYLMYVQTVMLPFAMVLSPRIIRKRRRLARLVARHPFPDTAFVGYGISGNTGNRQP